MEVRKLNPMSKFEKILFDLHDFSFILMWKSVKKNKKYQNFA